MASNKSSGLASVLDMKPDDSKTAQGNGGGDAAATGVAAIANRFNTGAMAGGADEGIKLSDRVSAMANRFGPTVVDDPAAGLRQSRRFTRPLDKSKLLAITSKAEDSNTPSSGGTVISESSGKSVGDVAAMFSSPGGFSSSSIDAEAEQAQPSGFSSAINMFQKAEQALQEPAESRVSSFAKRIDAGAKETDVPLPAPDSDQNKDKGKEEGDKPKPSVLSRYEHVTAAEKEPTPEERAQQEVASLGNRFANATKLFESGRANQLNDDPAQESKLSQLTSLVSDPTPDETSAPTPTPTTAKSTPSGPTPPPPPTPTPTAAADTPANDDAAATTNGTTAQDDAQEEASSPSARFANAARMFGGGI